jgi:hypothetical protein
MEPSQEDSVSAKSRKGKAAKAPSRKTSKIKVSLMLTEDVDFRLTVHSAAVRLDRSALANQLLDAALKRFVVQDRGRGEGEEFAETKAV